VTVTNTVGEYRKLAQADDNPGEYHIYQDSPEPESIKAACMPGQDLSMVSTNPLNPIAISPPNATTSKGKHPTNSGCSLFSPLNMSHRI
jgi:hypothetical protein